MKKVWISIAAVLLVAVVGIGIYIASIDWNRYKDDIAAQVSQMSGKKLVFSGPFEFTMFPAPYMVAQDVKIFNPSSVSDKPIAEIKKMVVDLSLVPLLQGTIDIKHMSFIEPLISIEFLEDNKLNWQSDLSAEQVAQIRNSNVMLNSLTLEKGTLLFNDEDLGIDWKFDNLNAEIIAPNLLGPYRIEGSYLRGGNPEGIAISLGQFTENFATSLNLVLTHPQTDSYLRFDGTFLLSNRSINGNLMLESRLLKNFIEHNFSDLVIDAEYDYPLSINTAVNANKTQVDLSGLTLKYGDTVGSGNLLLPLNVEATDAVKHQLEMALNFTNLDLEPLAGFVKEMLDTYKSSENKLQMPNEMNVIGDVRAVNAVYNGQDVKDLSCSFDYKNGELDVNNLSAALPGDTSFDMRGNLFAQDGMPNYDMEVSFNSGDLTTLLGWLDINPQISNVGALRRGNGSANFRGTNEYLQISPFKVTIDKSTLDGQYAIKFGKRNDAMLVLNADMVNFDNYISPMPKEETEKGWKNRINYRFAELGFLNDFEMQIDARLDLGIYGGLPLENLELKATLVDGELDVTKFRVANAANMMVEALGKVKGFGVAPEFNGLRYNVITEDLAAWLNKMEIVLPNVNLKNITNFDSEGVISGNLDKFAMDGNFTLGKLKTSIDGELFEKDEYWNVNGMIKAEHPDFVAMLQDFNVNYNPQNYILGRFLLSTKMNGNVDSFTADEMILNIGVNEFRGNVTWGYNDNRPMITTSLNINSLELEKFLYDARKNKQQLFVAENLENVAMWNKPNWSTEKINYDLYKKFDAVADLKIKNFSFKKFLATDYSSLLKLNNGILELSNVKANTLGGDIAGALNLNMNNQTITVNGNVNKLDIASMKLSGTKYGLVSGALSAEGNVSSSVESSSEFLAKINGEVNLKMDNVLVKGWNLQNIYKDIENRSTSEGLAMLVKDNLSLGETLAAQLNLAISFNQGAFNFSNLQMLNENMLLTASGSGNVADWDMNTKWNVSYDKLANIPGFAFDFSGDMQNPDVSPDVEALAGLYDARMQKIEDERKAKEDAVKAEFQGLINSQKQISEALQSELEKLRQGLQGKSEVAANSLMKERFVELEQKDAELANELADILSKTSVDVIDNELLKELENRNNAATQNLEKLRVDLTQAYLDDAKLRNKESYDSFVELYNLHKNNLFAFNKANEELQLDLRNINLDYDLNKDAEIMQMQYELDKLEKGIEEFDDLLEKEYQAQQSNATAELWETYNQQMEPLIEKNMQNIKVADDLMQKYSAYAKAKVEDEKTIYNNKIRESEIKKKLEKNTGVISVKKTGKNLVITRDIEEIEKVEELKANEEVPVLDFSAKPETEKEVEEKVNTSKVDKVKKKLR